MKSNEIELLLHALDEGFDLKAWHGPNLRGALRRVRAEDAAWRPAPGRHNVWELAVHAAYWKYATWRRLTGARRGSFDLEGSNWFPRPEGPASERAWKADLAMLDRIHRSLRAVVSALDPKALRRRARGSRYTPAALVNGIAMHDVYHAGQIQLLKKLARGS
jgi:hypothetical protein